MKIDLKIEMKIEMRIEMKIEILTRLNISKMTIEIVKILEIIKVSNTLEIMRNRINSNL